MLNLTSNIDNTVYSYFISYTGVAPYSLSLVDNLDGFAHDIFELSLTPFGSRISYVVNPNLKEGDYTYQILDVNGKEMEKGFAQIKE